MIVLRKRQLLMRLLKLSIVIDDKNIYDLKEENPLLIRTDYSPTKIVAQNGYHSSKPLYIKKNTNDHVYLEVSCKANNTKLWAGLTLSVLLFVLFIVTHAVVFLILSNLPFLFLMYRFFVKHNEFITIGILDAEKKKTKNKVFIL
jgi:hypothetical protein